MTRRPALAGLALLSAIGGMSGPPPLHTARRDPWKTHSRARQTDTQRPVDEAERRREAQRKQRAARKRQRRKI